VQFNKSRTTDGHLYTHRMDRLQPDSRPLIDRRDREHQLWLTMRSAYKRYTDASEALTGIASRAPIAISARGGIDTLANRQRTAFEKYIEARMQYAEFVHDRSELAMYSSIQDTAGASAVPDHRQPGRFPSMTSRLILLAATGILLCTTAFSLAYLLRAQRRINDLDVARDEMRVTLTQTRDELQSVSRQVYTLNVPHQFASPDTGVPAAASPSDLRNSAYKSAASKKARAPRLNRIPLALSREQTPDAPGFRRNEPATTYPFTLTPSRQFKYAGTVGLSLRKVDPKQRYVDLCLMVKNSKLDKKHTEPYAPVWINMADRSQPITVVVTRIATNYVQGYVREPGRKRPEMTAADQVQRRVHRKS
jgi:hypothetical protein